MKPPGQLRRTAMPARRKRLQPGEKGLKQGAPLQCRTELGRGTKALERHTPMRRSVKPLPAVNKERKARKTEAAGLSKGEAQRIVRTRSGGPCELRIPGHCLGAGAQFAHRKPEGQGGEYVPSNGLRLCGLGNVNGCHGYQEQNRTESYEKGWLVRERDDHRKRPVWMWYGGVWGEWLLDDAGTAVPATDSGEAA